MRGDLKFKFITLLLSLSALLPIPTHAQTTNTNTNTTTNTITFNYTDDTKLTPSQVQTVLTLAKDCGLKSPAVIGTGKTLPSATRFIYVQSAEKTNDRKITFENVAIQYSEWSKGKSKREAGAKYLGDFWVTPPYLTTNSYTLFQINNHPVKLQFDEKIPLPLADKMLKSFEEGKIEFPSNSTNLLNITKEDLQNLIDLDPSNLITNQQLACYEMFIWKRQSTIRFTFTAEKIKILSTSPVAF